MANSARLDSGAEAILLRRSTVEANDFPSANGPPTAVIFGNGNTSVTHDHASIGPLPAIVCNDNDLKEDLVSVNPLLDSGYKLTMESGYETLFHEETQQTIHVT